SEVELGLGRGLLPLLGRDRYGYRRGGSRGGASTAPRRRWPRLRLSGRWRPVGLIARGLVRSGLGRAGLSELPFELLDPEEQCLEREVGLRLRSLQQGELELDARIRAVLDRG